jgi:ubiquinol-cytochrome c reductase cytochrome c1 subunit
MRIVIPIAVGLFFVISALWAFVVGAGTVIGQGYLKEETAEAVFHQHPKQIALSSDGFFGKFDKQKVQRGLQVYTEVCAACHSLKHVAFRDIAKLGYSEGQVKAFAASKTVPGIDPNTGEAVGRPGLPTDYFPSPYPNDIAAMAANGGRIPPDLSLMTKARHDGKNYVYSLLTGYQEAPAELLEKFPDSAPGAGTYYNPYFAALNIGMAPPLSDGQITYADGTEATVDQMAEDVAAFLVWTAEPTLEKRNQTGWPVLGFLLFATILAYLAYRNIWAEKKGH